MQFPDLSGLPPWAQVLVYVTFGISLALIIGAARFGIALGKKLPPASSSTSAEVAAVIVDPTAINKLSLAVSGIEIALASLNKTGGSLARATASEARETEELKEEIHRLGEAIERLRDELVRAAAKLE